MKNLKIYWLLLLIAFVVSFALPVNAQTKKQRKKSKVTKKIVVMAKIPTRVVTPTEIKVRDDNFIESNETNSNVRTKITDSVSGGVLNGKATSLPKPIYPAAAKAVKASGVVNVQILIDEEGNVISANATSGHPLLRAASEEAARSAKFSPTSLSGQKVKVSGIIVYNFVPQ
jgi:TonB family protein